MMYCGEVCNFCVRDCLLEDVILKIIQLLEIKQQLEKNFFMISQVI